MSVVKIKASLKVLRSSCFCGCCRKNFFTGKVWGLCKERFGTFFYEENRSKIDKHFVPSSWSAYQQKKIDKDFTQSYWPALQFVPTKKNKPDRIFIVVCHRHLTELIFCKSSMKDFALKVQQSANGPKLLSVSLYMFWLPSSKDFASILSKQTFLRFLREWRHY